MNRHQIMALGIFLGIPLFFLILSMITGNWFFFLWSLLPAFVSGMTGLMSSKGRSDIERRRPPHR